MRRKSSPGTYWSMNHHDACVPCAFVTSRLLFSVQVRAPPDHAVPCRAEPMGHGPRPALASRPCAPAGRQAAWAFRGTWRNGLSLTHPLGVCSVLVPPGSWISRSNWLARAGGVVVHARPRPPLASNNCERKPKKKKCGRAGSRRGTCQQATGTLVSVLTCLALPGVISTSRAPGPAVPRAPAVSCLRRV
jgi:hypothetical protein